MRVACWLVERGVNLRVVQKLMGHCAIQTTFRHAHVSDELLADAATRLCQVDCFQLSSEVGALAVGQGDGLEQPRADQQTQLASRTR
jgi:Phage integrase family